LLTRWDELAEESAQAQYAVMETWFRERFENPADRTPYETAEGGYQWIWGGPYDAEEELTEEFEGYVPTGVIERLASALCDENPEWAPVATADDYDFELDERVRANLDPFSTYREAARAIAGLLELPHDAEFDDALHRMLFANVIAALETYLCDTFLLRLEAEPDHVRRFIETYTEFRERKISYADVFRKVDEAPDEIRRMLLELTWHNMSKVQALYRDVLGIDLRPVLPEVARAIPIRHDIVHRNGKDLDGQPVPVDAGNVRQLLEHSMALVIQINCAPWAFE
jgi:hypothetical protein